MSGSVWGEGVAGEGVAGACEEEGLGVALRAVALCMLQLLSVGGDEEEAHAVKACYDHVM